MLEVDRERNIKKIMNWGFFHNIADADDAIQETYYRMLNRAFIYTGIDGQAFAFFNLVLRQVCVEMAIKNNQVIHCSAISNSVEFQEVFLETYLKSFLASQGLDQDDVLRYVKAEGIDIINESIIFNGQIPSESRDYRLKQMKAVIERLVKESGFCEVLLDHLCDKFSMCI
jgi:hypothetical protein